MITWYRHRAPGRLRRHSRAEGKRPHFYTLEGALRLRDALAAMKKGRILVVVDIPTRGRGLRWNSS